MEIDDKSTLNDRRCVKCSKNEYWNKFTGKCTLPSMNQYIIFGEAKNVLPKQDSKVLTSNGIYLPKSETHPEFTITGTLVLKILKEIKGGLSFYIVNGENESQQYMIQKPVL